MSDLIDAFIEEARGIGFASVAERFGRVVARRAEWTGPCPRCGGEDRYAVNARKGVWLCRGCGAGGKDAIGLAAHEIGVDVRRQDGLLAACAEVLQKPVPEGGAVESEEARAARLARMEVLRREGERQAEVRATREAAEREKAIRKARGLYFNAGEDNGTVATYLGLRTGFKFPAELFENLRFDPTHSYWSEKHRDERGYATAIHAGPAMVAPFVTLDGEVVGSHETWIDLAHACGPKFRVVLSCRTEAGAKAGAALLPPGTRPAPEWIDAGHYEQLPSKKMQGVKKGALIPLLGEMAATRWVAAEGIESALGFAALDGFRVDTFYCAAGDMGNLAGKADPASSFNHPTIKDQDRRGRWRARRIAGPEPAREATDRALQLPAHVAEFLIAVDGDSEFYWTASAIARAEARLARDGLTIVPCWPPNGMDWADVAKAAALAMKDAA